MPPPVHMSYLLHQKGDTGKLLLHLLVFHLFYL